MVQVKIIMKLVIAVSTTLLFLGSAAHAQKPLSLFGHALGEAEPEGCKPDEFQPGLDECSFGTRSAYYRAGKLVLIMDSVETTDRLLPDAVKKYGPPTSQKWETVQNGLGAKFRNRISTWELPTAYIRLEEKTSPHPEDPDRQSFVIMETRAERQRDLATKKNRPSALD